MNRERIGEHSDLRRVASKWPETVNRPSRSPTGHINSLRNRFSKPVAIFSTLMAALSFAANATAGPIEVTQLAAFINAPALGAQSLEDTRIGSGFNELPAAGLGVVFSNNLSADNIGTVSWLISNDTGADLTDVDFFAFLDAEIVEPGNSFFNEFGTLVDVSGTGTGDTLADSWEIDEPGFLFGDIFSNLLAGALDDINAVPVGLEDDVSLALGFQVGDLLVGERILATFELSLDDIGGLSHTDPDLALTFFFNGSVQVLPASVAEPSSLTLLGIALLGLGLPVSRGVTRRARVVRPATA